MPAPRIRAFSDGKYVLEFDQLASTQDEARARILAGEDRLVGVRADYQAQGRGRRGASWYAPRGKCLLVTYIVPVSDPSARGQALLSMAAALAVAEGIADLTHIDARVRWPNDVVVGAGKLAGVLVELARAPLPSQPDRHVALVGIGANVNVLSWPTNLASEAVSLQQITGRSWSVQMVEAAVRTGLIQIQRHMAGDNPQWFLRRWMARDATIGTRYTVHSPGGLVSGTALAINEHGELTIVTDAGERVTAVSGHHTR